MNQDRFMWVVTGYIIAAVSVFLIREIRRWRLMRQYRKFRKEALATLKEARKFASDYGYYNATTLPKEDWIDDPKMELTLEEIARGVIPVKEGLCQCSCATDCPLKRYGSQERCTYDELEQAGIAVKEIA